MEQLKDLANLKPNSSLLDIAVDLADELVDNYLMNVDEDEYFIYKFKFMLVFELLDYLKGAYFRNFITDIEIKELLDSVWREVVKLKKDIFNDWKQGKLYKDKQVDISKVKTFHDKMYYRLVKKLPPPIGKKEEREVKKILRLE